MERRQKKVRINWFWGLLGFLGILGFIFEEPLYYTFFSFFLFFIEPIDRRSKNSERDLGKKIV